MKIIAINGSPRRNWNTATLLQKALEGAASKGAQTEIIHLYDENFRGCVSCYSCKQMGARHRCVVHDDLSRILERMSKADGLIFGSPIYFGTVSSSMSACLERFLFPYIMYNHESPSVFGRKMPSAFIYTMDSLNEQLCNEKEHLNGYENSIRMILGEAPEILKSCDTWRYENCSQCENTTCDRAQRGNHRKEQFPKDCERAYQIGVCLAERVLGIKD